MSIESESKLNTDESWVALSRQLYIDFINNKLTSLQLILIVVLYLKANPVRGICTTSYAGLVAALKGQYSKNSINKSMLDLKQKKYIWFRGHKGSRGEFEVELEGFFMTTGAKKDISDRFNQRLSRGSGVASEEQHAKVNQVLNDNNQNLEVTESVGLATQNFNQNESAGRGNNNENESENFNEKDTSGFSRKNLHPNEFNPISEDEEHLKQMAILLDEKRMSYLLSVYEIYGLKVLDDAWEIFTSSSTDNLENKGAYFNRIVNDIKTSSIYENS